MYVNYTDRVIRFILELDWEDLSPDLQHQARRCLLDALGALIAGAKTPPAKLMASIAESQFQRNGWSRAGNRQKPCPPMLN